MSCELPSFCPYCNEPLINQYLTFKNSESTLQICDKKLSHKLEIFSENGNNPTRLTISIFTKNREENNLFIWNFKQKLFHINDDLVEWINLKLDFNSFHNIFKRIEKLKILL